MKTFNVKLFYVYKFTGQCLPIYAFYTILFLERGRTVTEVALLIALWSGFALVFELPSGVLADRWNRRNMLAIAAGLQGLCFVIWYVSHTVFQFAVGFLFWGLACALVSGTEEGLIYDNLRCDGHAERFTQVYGRAKFFANTGTVAGIASAGVLAMFLSVGAMALLSAAICLFNVVLVLQIREKNAYADHLDSDSAGFLDTAKQAGRFIRGNRVALITVLFLVLFAGICSYLDEYDALIIHDLGLGNSWVSVILVVRFGAYALGDLLAPVVRKWIASIGRMILLSGLACVFLLLFAVFWNRLALPVLGLAFMATAVTEILLVNALQGEIREEGRATVMSVYSLGQNAVVICFSLVYGLLAGMFPLRQVYMIIAGYGVAGGVGVYLLCKAVDGKI